jgi:hypothetical protein
MFPSVSITGTYNSDETRKKGQKIQDEHFPYLKPQSWPPISSAVSSSHLRNGKLVTLKNKWALGFWNEIRSVEFIVRHPREPETHYMSRRRYFCVHSYITCKSFTEPSNTIILDPLFPEQICQYTHWMTSLRFPARAEISFLFVIATRPARGPTNPPIQWMPRVLFAGVKRPGHCVTTPLNLEPRLRARGSIPPFPHTPSMGDVWLSTVYVFMKRYLFQHMDNFMFYLQPFTAYLKRTLKQLFINKVMKCMGHIDGRITLIDIRLLRNCAHSYKNTGSTQRYHIQMYKCIKL